MEFDSTGNLLRGNQWDNITGYKIGGFHIKSNLNAFAMHFAPSLPTKISRKSVQVLSASAKLKCSVAHGKAVFSLLNAQNDIVSLQVFNASDKKVAHINKRKTAGSSIIWDYSSVSRGIYLYNVELENSGISGTVVVR